MGGLVVRGGSKRVRWAVVGTMMALVGGLGSLGVPGRAHAATSTLYVGSAAGGNRSCASPGYTSVQAAVDAAGNGARVYLCGANTYTGPVVITKSITLTGDPGATISPPANLNGIPASRLPPQFTTDNLFSPNAIVMVWGSGVSATISGLNVSGPFNTQGCEDDIYGVLVLDGGSAAVTHDTISNIRAANPNLLGCQYGNGVRAGREYWPTADHTAAPVEDFIGSVQIIDTTITGYQKNGVTVDGPGSQADIVNSRVTGDGRVNYIAQNGIQISRGATGSIHNSTVSNNAYTGAGRTYATGVLLYGGCGDPLVTGADVHNNTLTNNDVGVYAVNLDDGCTTPPPSATNIQIHNNDISNDAVTNTTGYDGSRGYQAGIAEYGNGDTIHNNTISGAGYQAQNTASAVVLPIDAAGSANLSIHNNTIH